MNEWKCKLLPPAVQQAIADEYETGEHDPHRGWAQLAAAARRFRDQVEAGERGICSLVHRACVEHFTVQRTDSPAYDSADGLAALLLEGEYQTTASPESFTHPVWTFDEWETYLLWHDVIGHVESGHGFDPDGELRAFAIHTRGESQDFKEALFVQQLCPIIFALVRGYFIPARAPRPGPVGREIIETICRRI